MWFWKKENVEFEAFYKMMRLKLFFNTREKKYKTKKYNSILVL